MSVPGVPARGQAQSFQPLELRVCEAGPARDEIGRYVFLTAPQRDGFGAAGPKVFPRYVEYDAENTRSRSTLVSKLQ